MSFVFMCLEGPARKLIVDKLEEFGLACIDVGMGVYPPLSGGRSLISDWSPCSASGST